MNIVRVTETATLETAIAGANVFTFKANGKMIPGIQFQGILGSLRFESNKKYLMSYSGMNLARQPQVLKFSGGSAEQLRCFSAEPYWTANNAGKEFPVIAAKTPGNKVIIVAVETCEFGKDPVGNCGYIYQGGRDSAVLMDDGAKLKYQCPTAVVSLLPGDSLEVLTSSVAYKLENLDGTLKNTSYGQEKLNDLARRIDWRVAASILNLVKETQFFEQKYAGLWTVGFSLAGEILQETAHSPEILRGFAKIALHAQDLGFRLPPIVGDVLTEFRNKLGIQLEQQLESKGVICKIKILPTRTVKGTGENWTPAKDQKQAPKMPAPLLDISKTGELAAMFG